MDAIARKSPNESTGRPRDQSIDGAVITAALRNLDEFGYSRFALDRVAREAGTTKPAIYRRWPTRQHLVLDALAARLGEVQAPDTDCTLCDLAGAIKMFVAVFERMSPGVLDPLLADCSGEPRLQAEFMRTLFTPPRIAVGQTLDRASARGDLRDDLDRELTLDLLSSLVHYRVLFGHAPITDAEVQGAVTTLLRGVAVDYPRLLEISRRETVGPSVHRHHT